MQRIYRWFIVALVAIQSVTGALPAWAQGNSHAVALSQNTHDKMLLTLTGDAVGPNRVQLALSATPLIDAPALQVRWEVGIAQMMDGPPAETLGAVAAEGVAEQTRTVLLPGAGHYRLMAVVTYLPYAGAQYGAATTLFAIVGAQGIVTLTTRDPDAVSPMHSIMPAEVIELTPQAAIAGVNATDDDDPCFDVVGNISREDRINTQSGQLPPVRVPVRNALVELWEEDLFFDDNYGEMVTDLNGNYGFSFCDDDGIFDDDLELYISLRAELYLGDMSAVEVTDYGVIEETYEYESEIIESDGGSYTVNFALDATQSGIFNIADALLDGYIVWNRSGGAVSDSQSFEDQAEAMWEAGSDEQTAYHGDVYDEITVANGDEWDDAVILHEWGHMADDKYSCDDSTGAPHNMLEYLADPEQAWGEGYPDYFQSAVRSAVGAIDGNFYINADAAGNNIGFIDLELNPVNALPNIESAIASMLWDLADSANDGQDMSGMGHAVLQRVYTHPIFESNGTVDDTCTVFQYLLAWKDLGMPTDAATAASITQNIGSTTPFGLEVAANAAMVQSTAVQDASATNGAVTAEDYIWWQKVTMVADNSASMAGDKLDAVKTVMAEQVNDLQDPEKGVEFDLYTFNNTQPGSQKVVQGRFYADAILPSIQGLTTTPPGGEPCKVNAFNALADSIQERHNAQVWLYTDGETMPGPGVEAMQQMLTTRGLQSSFVLMGGCSAPPDTPQATYATVKHSFIGKALSGEQPSGIVPYLLTAIATGGNFLFVDESQLSDAGDILRAQLSHSAGAGRWSDYVSNTATYSWDKMTRWEYEWVTPSAQDFRGEAVDNPLEIAIPPVTVYGRSYDTLGVEGDGYIQMGVAGNGPTPFAEKHYLNLLKGDLTWEVILTAITTDNAPNAGGNYNQDVYATERGEWVVITVEGTRFVNEPRAYQALINKNTGEIRYQYKDVPAGDSGIAVIGTKAVSPVIANSTEVVVSNKDDAGAQAGRGYKFTPMPPQPSKTFTVPVDGLMDGVGFLLTGYSGSFSYLKVTAPDGTQVDCNQPGTLCLHLGLVQYVQTNVNGRTGDWHVEVTPGMSGEGTFSLSAMGASAIKVESPSRRRLALGQPTPLLVNLGAPAEGNQATVWFQRPDGTQMGEPFTLFDDGAHGDGAAGDGKFGLGDFMPPGEGVAYLWLSAKVQGTQLQRSDPVPYHFQLFDVVGPETMPYFGTGALGIDYTMTNMEAGTRCFSPSAQMPDGWNGTWELSAQEELLGICLNPNQSATRRLNVTPTSLQDPAPSGSTGEVIVTLREVERGELADSAATMLTRYNAPAKIVFGEDTAAKYLRPNGSDTASLLVGVFDEQGFPVIDGTLVELSTTLGTVTPAQGGTVNGRLHVMLTAGDTTGDAVVTAHVGALATNSTVRIRAAQPEMLEFEVTPGDLREQSSASLIATVLDPWGDPVANQIIRIGVEDDDDSGAAIAAAGEQATTASIQRSEVVTLTTNAQGEVVATYAKPATASGRVMVRAELLFDEGTGLHVVREERRIIVLNASGLYVRNVYLPVIGAEE